MNEAIPVIAKGRTFIFLFRLFSGAATGDMLAKAGVFGVTLLAVRSLDAVSFAQLIGLQAVAVLAFAVGDFGVTTLLTREVAAANLSPQGALNQALRLRLLTFPLWIGTLTIGVILLGRARPLPFSVISCIALSSRITGLYQIVLAILRARLQFFQAGISLAIGRWSGVGIALIMLQTHLVPSPFASLAVSITAGDAIALVLTIIFASSLMQSDAETSEKAKVLTLGSALPFAFIDFIQIAYNRLDVLIVAAIATTNVLSAYAPASRIQDTLLLIPSVSASILMPLAASRDAARGDQPGRSSFLWVVVTSTAVISSLLLSVVVFVSTRRLISLVAGDDFQRSVTPIRIIVWSIPLIAFNGCLASLVVARNRPYLVTLAIIAAFVVALALNLVLVPLFGANGAAMAATLREIPVACVLLYGGVKFRVFTGGTVAAQKEYK